MKHMTDGHTWIWDAVQEMQHQLTLEWYIDRLYNIHFQNKPVAVSTHKISLRLMHFEEKWTDHTKLMDEPCLQWHTLKRRCHATKTWCNKITMGLTDLYLGESPGTCDPPDTAEILWLWHLSYIKIIYAHDATFKKGPIFDFNFDFK